jgi:hypothetical protein
LDEDGTGAASARDLEKDRKFQEVLGISKHRLRVNGTDPDAYMAEHIHEALRDPKKREILLSQSTIIRQRYFKEAKRVYTWMFTTVGVLLLSAIPHAHSTKRVVIYLAFVPFAAVVWAGIRQIQTARLYRQIMQGRGHRDLAVRKAKVMRNRSRRERPSCVSDGPLGSPQCAGPGCGGPVKAWFSPTLNKGAPMTDAVDGQRCLT